MVACLESEMALVSINFFQNSLTRVHFIIEYVNSEKSFEAVCEIALEACQGILSQESMKWDEWIVILTARFLEWNFK